MASREPDVLHWLAHSRRQNLDPFSSLRILSIQSNRLTKLENLDHLTSLEELYVSHNGLEVIEGLSELKRLRVLDVGGNKIEAIGGLEGLTELEEFWVSKAGGSAQSACPLCQPGIR